MTSPDRLRPGLYPIETAVPAERAEPQPEPREPGAADALPAPAAIPPRQRARHPGRWFAIALGLLLAGLLGIDAALFLLDMFERHWLLGLGFSALIGMVVASLVYWVAAEARQIRLLKSVDLVRAEAQAAMASDAHGEAPPFIAHAKQLIGMRPGMRGRFERLEDMILDTHSDRDVLELFRREILHPLDREAYGIVARSAQWAAVGVSVSPIALIDALVTIWRSLRMIRRIAEVYGFRPGFVSTIFLTRHVLAGAAFVSTVDVVGDLWVQHLGGRLAGLVSAKLAEGVYVAVRVARLGLLTMETCRPLPFLADDEPSLNRLRREVLAGLVEKPARAS